ncbi:MAG: Cna protein B-type domain, TonB-dependent Receptor Plug Domain protein, partial [Acidobacteriaceae bacterium]|nr:Cna protein B-type domain, TonB-dependent Receptor Plug Domain protein [Acidobacteriaceae bacterium]
WALDGILHARSAPPFDVIYLPAVSKFYDDQTPSNMYFRADAVPGQPFWISDPAAPGGRILNPAAFSIPTFAAPADSRQGTLGRNAIRAFPSLQMDIALRREFALDEKIRLTFRMDAFNIFNHPNFGYPQNNWTVNGFGQPYATLAQTLGSGNGFGGGFNPLYAVGGPRSMQASLKLQF